MKKVGIFGWNGKKNVGDDAMTSVIVQKLVNEIKADTFFLWGHEADFAEYIKDANIQIKGFWNYNFFSRIKIFGRWYLKEFCSKRFVKDNQLLIFGGGSIFHKKSLSQRYLRIIKLAKKSNRLVQIAAISVSVGPFENQEDEVWAIKALSKFDFISVRDTRSLKLLKENKLSTKVVESPDVALLFPPFLKMKIVDKKYQRKYFGVSLRFGFLDDSLANKIAKSCEEIFRTYPTYRLKIINFSAFIHEPDSNCTAKLIGSILECYQNRIDVIEYSPNVDEMYRHVLSCDFMICMRLHAAVISYATKTPFLIIPYRSKCLDFGRDIARLNDDYFLFDSDQTEKVVSKVKFISKNEKHPHFDEWGTVIEKAYQNFDFL
ncbi:MAG TPA: polysaccharide pyruvyl transferase family protein [Bacteroidetes bacterium]|nr:polysaccharide pyruvyl transferase family protein [Bacteroidota bacterium]